MDGRMALVSFEGGAIARTEKRGGRCWLFRAESAHGRGDDFTWRGWQWGPTRSIASRTQVPHYIYNLFCFFLVFWHHGPTPLSTYVVVNKRENCTRSGRQLGPSSSSSICVFEVWALQSFSMFSPDINFSPLNNNENIAAGINWAGCGPSSPGQISSLDINFFQAENG